MTPFLKIRNLRSEKGWTQGDLAKFSGVSIETIKRYENGKSNATSENLQKIANALGVEIQNLYSENMSLSKSLSPVIKSSFSSHLVQNNAKISDLSFTDENSVFIRTITSKVGAGESVDIDGISVIDSGECVAFSKLLFKTPPKLANLRAMQVSGYSMVPMLYPDSWVIVEISPCFDTDGLYVLDFDGSLMVKMVQKSPNGELDIISINKEYKSYHIAKGDNTQIKIIGKVLRCVI